MASPTYQHADNHPHYLPRPVDPRAIEVESVLRQINRMKVEEPQLGRGIYDDLIDRYVAQSSALLPPANSGEPAHLTPPERCVWRSALTLTNDRRAAVIASSAPVKDAQAFAAVRGGRWLVPCPFPGCNGAQYACWTDRRFFCVDCNNRAVKGAWVEVVWPDDPSEVEGWLNRRPSRNRNWDPGETGDDIAAQDAAEGGE